MARTGKIAQLSFDLREQINQRLLDGWQGPELLSWLNGLEDVRVTALQRGWQQAEITDGNLSEWRAGGFAEWAAERAKILRMEAWVEVSQRLARAAGGSLAGAAADVAAGRIMELLMDDASLPDSEENADVDVLNMGRTLASLRAAETAASKAGNDRAKLALATQKLEQDQRKLEMAAEKFRREMAGNFLDWYADDRTRRIAESTAPREEKVAQLSLLADLYFGEAPEDAGLPAGAK